MRTNKIISLLIALTVMMTFAVGAWAVGTTAGTNILNTATVTFQNAAGTAQAPVVSNTVVTTVIQVAAVSIATTQPTINVVPGQLNVANYFTITNGGNYADQFEIVPLTNASVSNIRYYVNTLANATLTTFDGVGTAVALTASGANFLTPVINSTPASTSVPANTYPNGTTIFVVVDIPANASGGLVAGGGKVQGAGTVKSVFSKNSVVSTGTATMIDNIQVGTLTISKTVQNVIGTPGPVGTTATGKPGDTLQYVITITNTGTGDAKAVQLTDPVDANTTYVAASDVFTSSWGAVPVAANSQVAVPAATAANRVYNLGYNTTAAAGGTIPAGGIVTVTFRVTIN